MNNNQNNAFMRLLDENNLNKIEIDKEYKININNLDCKNWTDTYNKYLELIRINDNLINKKQESKTNNIGDNRRIK